MVALIPVLGFAQTAKISNSQRTAQVVPANNIRVIEKAPLAKEQPVTVVLTEKQEYDVWLKENADLQKMSNEQLILVIEQNENKLARVAGSNENQLANLRREIKWMKEILSAK